MNQLAFHFENSEQYRAMEELVRDAFWDKYSPGCSEHLVVHNMRTAPAAVKDLCLAAEQDGELVGGIWYADAVIRQPDGTETPVLTMGPVAVRPDLQGKGIGSALIRKTLDDAAGRCCAVIIYGNPAYYGRFGFKPSSEFGITDSMGEECPAIQVYPMGDVPSGAFDEGAVYAVMPAEVRAFDASFPHRQRHLNSRQLFFAPPCPPPEDPVLKASWELRNRASAFLRNSGILEAWESIGAKIRCVGSYRSDLMIKDRDIDLHIYTPSLDVAQALKAMEPILTNPKTLRLTYVNGANTDEFCLEWHLKMNDDAGETWSVNIIQILAGSKFDGFFEDTAEAIIDAMTPESRKRILELKAAEPEGMNICGIEFYKAALADHVASWEEFVQWRKSNPPESLMTWRP